MIAMKRDERIHIRLFDGEAWSPVYSFHKEDLYGSGFGMDARKGDFTISRPRLGADYQITYRGEAWPPILSGHWVSLEALAIRIQQGETVSTLEEWERARVRLWVKGEPGLTLE